MTKAFFKKCTGEAHGNPYIDNCMICAPFWGIYPICPVDDKTSLSDKGYCKKCKRHFDITSKPRIITVDPIVIHQ